MTLHTGDKQINWYIVMGAVHLNGMANYFT